MGLLQITNNAVIPTKAKPRGGCARRRVQASNRPKGGS